MARTLTRANRIERRGCQRHDGTECRWITSARLRPGRDVTLLNLSSRGAQVEAASRLLPGTSVELQLAALDRRWLRSAQVLRCHVSALVPEGGVRYRAALRFDEALDLPFAEGVGKPGFAAHRKECSFGYCLPGREALPKATTGNAYPVRQWPIRSRRRKWAVSHQA
jgi:hypothetical protein